MKEKICFGTLKKFFLSLFFTRRKKEKIVKQNAKGEYIWTLDGLPMDDTVDNSFLESQLERMMQDLPVDDRQIMENMWCKLEKIGIENLSQDQIHKEVFYTFTTLRQKKSKLRVFEYLKLTRNVQQQQKQGV